MLLPWRRRGSRLPEPSTRLRIAIIVTGCQQPVRLVCAGLFSPATSVGQGWDTAAIGLGAVYCAETRCCDCPVSHVLSGVVLRLIF
jgi:hypothetical protein